MLITSKTVSLQKNRKSSDCQYYPIASFMLIKFRVGNYLSFNEIVELDLSAASIKQHAATHVTYISDDIKLLKSVTIHGPNGSGKSNILKALHFVYKFIFESDKEKEKDMDTEMIDIEHFKLLAKSELKPSHFQIEFLIGDTRYRYGFELNKFLVLNEWLYVVQRQKEHMIFKRGHATIVLGDKYLELQQLESITKSQTLFLSTLARFKHKATDEVIRWFKKMKFMINAADRSHYNYTTKLLLEPIYAAPINKLLKYADLGFNEVTAKKGILPSLDQLTELESIELRRLLLQELMNKKDELQVLTKHSKYDESFNKVGDVEFDMLKHESLGTQKLFSLAGPIIDALLGGKLLIIDEFDSRLHPLICRLVINLFNSTTNNPNNAQLIIVSLNTNLFDNAIFRRDQILLTQKSKIGATVINSLYQKNARSDESFEKNYFEGAYGAMPDLTQETVALF